VSLQDRLKWDARYAEGAYAERLHASECLRQWLPRVPQGRALDIACGAGRNALYLAANGFSVDALDISAVALARARDAARLAGIDVRWIEHDLDDGLPVQGPYQLVTQLRYVNDAVTSAAPGLLAAGGFFVCEQHLRTQAAVSGPQSPRFRVAAGQLERLVPGLEIIALSEGLRTDPDGQRVALATLVARRPGKS